MTLVALTVAGAFAVDLDEETVEPWDEAPPPSAAPVLNLPRVLDAAAAGSTVVALVDAKPPLLVSHDAGATWRDSGRGLPPGRAVAIDQDDPDLVAYGARNRLYVSRDGGVFWHALAVELPELERLVFA
jgi:hypothetical protein